MGQTFSPEDATRKRRSEVASRDLNPALRESVLRILNEWQGTKSKEELGRILGNERADAVLKKVGFE